MSGQSEIAAFSIDRKPLSRKEFEIMIDEGEKDIDAGRVHSHEEVKAYFEKKVAPND